MTYSVERMRTGWLAEGMKTHWWGWWAAIEVDAVSRPARREGTNAERIRLCQNPMLF
jgi:hypothetical protein